MNSIKQHFDSAKQKGLVQTNVSILTRLISTVRDRAAENIWRKLCCLCDNAQKKQLEKLLQVDQKQRLWE
ncbi:MULTISPECIES: hypothetical protein [Bacillus]|uniref:hypothetical protein n=1 Tax=Bacillus TaxID=1386 RepID=UPI0020CA1E3D|nr:hypothetical protein [Bacillus cereus]